MSRVVKNAHRYINKPSKKTTSVLDLFKDYRTEEEKEYQRLKDRMAERENSFRKTLMSAKDREYLANSKRLERLFSVAKVKCIKLDNSKYKNIEELQHEKEGKAFVSVEGETVYLNKVSKIEEVEYQPGCLPFDREYETLNLYKKHQSGNDVLVTRISYPAF